MAISYKVSYIATIHGISYYKSSNYYISNAFSYHFTFSYTSLHSRVGAAIIKTCYISQQKKKENNLIHFWCWKGVEMPKFIVNHMMG